MKNNVHDYWIQKKITIIRLLSLLFFTVILLFLPKELNIIILIASLVLALLFGRLWCGYVCPLGFYQECLSALRKKLNLPNVRFTEKTKRRLKPLKYIILVVFLGSIILIGYRPNMFMRPDTLFWENKISIIASIVVGIVTGISFCNERIFCKYCPLGTVRSFFNKTSRGKLKKDGTACTKCRVCLENCPMDVKEIYDERTKSIITSRDCIYCMKCIEACPEKEVLSFNLFGKTVMKSDRKTDVDLEILKNQKERK